MSDIEKRLERIERLLILGTKDVFNMHELALFLDISEDRIRHLVCERKIPHYKQGSRTFFKKKDIENWQTAVRIPTNEEIENKATTYAALHR